MKNKILIVEDDDNLRMTLEDNLDIEGYDVISFTLIERARQYLTASSVDLIVLDLMLPDGDGFELCRWIRNRSDVLILMLTAKSVEKDVIEGFISGADDYVNKPYRASELLLRINALLKRKYGVLKEKRTLINGFTVIWENHEVIQDGHSIHLTKTAFDILAYLYKNLNRTCSRDDILNAVWGEGIYVDNRTVDNFVSSLKKQLNLSDERSYYIKTIRSIGYMLVRS